MPFIIHGDSVEVVNVLLIESFCDSLEERVARLLASLADRVVTLQYLVSPQILMSSKRWGVN